MIVYVLREKREYTVLYTIEVLETPKTYKIDDTSRHGIYRTTLKKTEEYTPISTFPVFMFGEDKDKLIEKWKEFVLERAEEERRRRESEDRKIRRLNRIKEEI